MHSALGGVWGRRQAGALVLDWPLYNTSSIWSCRLKGHAGPLPPRCSRVLDGLGSAFRLFAVDLLGTGLSGGQPRAQRAAARQQLRCWV